MLFGHNSNVVVGTDTIHVQTEDRGATVAVIDTTVHWKGRVLHRRTSKYADLLPLDERKTAVLKDRIDQQHRAVIEEIRSGALKLTLPLPTSAPSAAAVSQTHHAGAGNAATLKVELLNAKSWLSGKNATLQLVVRDSGGQTANAAEVKVHVEGSATPAAFSAITGADGAATLQFEMPKLVAAEAGLAIEASSNGAKGHLRFQLRAKPKP
jgi:hypothetical protein